MINPKSKDSLNIAQIFVAIFYCFNNRVYCQKSIRCFFLIITFITQELIRCINFIENYLELKTLFEITIKKIFAHFIAKFYNLKIVFIIIK